MDTSETYILMCEKATEIQENFRSQYLDFYIRSSYDRGRRRISVCHGGQNIKVKVWIPRQDQLQAMIDLKNYVHDDMIEVLLDWAGWIRSEADDNWKVFRQYETGEQLWLAFVMKEKYGEKWNGDDWVKE